MSSKREAASVPQNNEDSEDECIGPSLSEAAPPKKRKTLEYEQLYLSNLPSAESYEKSYMHRDTITHVAVTRTDFLITASCDGHIKFWKKTAEGIEFVKHFKSHLGTIADLSTSVSGELCCTVSDDKTCKVFDVVNFDMINMLRLGFLPLCSGFIYRAGDALSALAVSEKEQRTIRIYDARGDSTPLKELDKMHGSPVTMIKYNPVMQTVVSTDQMGMIEYWTGPRYDYKFPKNVSWEFKTDTDLYEYAKNKTLVTGMAFSPNGKLIATISKDRKVRILKFVTGKITKVLDETLQNVTELQQRKQLIPNMEFGRRVAVERELEKSEAFQLNNIIFDESGNFILYPTILGVKVVNIVTNECRCILGKVENVRFLQVALCQGTGKLQAAVTVEMEASDNPALQKQDHNPTLFCTAFKKNRFYLFTRRDPSVSLEEGERDVFNEKPSKEELAAATQDTTYTRVAENAVIHTSMGDLQIKLFPKECPKTVENFCVHSRNGYFNGHIFHRVIKGFMIQTGDPQGNGTGGESIWGGEFEDEFHPSLRHDRPYTLSMANAGANTNGSQFFVTVVPTPWLDNKHTVFGRVIKGMDVAQNIGNVKTNPKTDKPHDDIRIISVTIK